MMGDSGSESGTELSEDAHMAVELSVDNSPSILRKIFFIPMEKNQHPQLYNSACKITLSGGNITPKALWPFEGKLQFITQYWYTVRLKTKATFQPNT